MRVRRDGERRSAAVDWTTAEARRAVVRGRTGSCGGTCVVSHDMTCSANLFDAHASPRLHDVCDAPGLDELAQLVAESLAHVDCGLPAGDALRLGQRVE